ncbi:hypothetical protein MPTK1_3g08590 [Marchantia polymorpha subsp. ruderalis]|uniref:Uncharacterized protein n=2 Tax=Marchantia polymorpha TaxID=3197 RepID=A0AAF6AYQ8_MARPO|nr:hypothetical protein MARPO_0105s0058 [Marchantia polymorpha]BBN04892.1 hypothetical protein Mp_3g08590 [Marchantia polymorpha subsp. ruderalis]|eukprot:PTQ31952.1 hypothetical protein MARPO_0105s0058 [Marchantia polymorpha]
MSVCVSPVLAPAWNVDLELQKELDAVSIRSHLSSSSSSAGDDEYETKGDDREALALATNARLDMLLDGWRVKEKKLQEYEQTLNRIRLWQGGLISDEEMRGKESEDKSVSSSKHHIHSDPPEQVRPQTKFLAEATSMSKTHEVKETETQRDLKQSLDCIKLSPIATRVPDFITRLGETPQESPCSNSLDAVSSCNTSTEKHDNSDLKFSKTNPEYRESKETVCSESCSSAGDFEEDAITLLNARRTKMLEEFRAAEVQRTREWNQRRKVDSEESERKMALASERRQELEVELQKEQRTKLATLETEQRRKLRLLEELQRTEESNLESEKQEMEVRYKALTDISDTYKHLEEELDLRRLDHDDTVREMLSQAIRSQEQINNPGISNLQEDADDSHAQRCCIQIQALVRGHLCRKKYKFSRHHESEIDRTPQTKLVLDERCSNNMQETTICEESGNKQSPARTPDLNCKNWQLYEEVLDRLTDLAGTGNIDDIYPCLELAKAIGLDEEARAVEDEVYQRKESTRNWLTQVINGWDTGRVNLQKHFEEANRVNLAPLYAVAEAVVFAREKEIGESLEMAISRASRWDFYLWMCRAKVMGMEEVLTCSYQLFQRKLKLVKDALEKESKLGTKDQYSIPFQEATSMGLQSETGLAMKVILKRVLQFIRRAIVLVGTKSSKRNPRAQDWKTVEHEGTQIGLDMTTMEYLRQAIISSRTLECVKRVWITKYKTSDTGVPIELINKRHGSVAGWDNTLVYPTNGPECEIPEVSNNNGRSSNPATRLPGETWPSVDSKLREDSKWVMPHNWLEMLRLQSLWQQQMISERTSGLLDFRPGSQEAKKINSEYDKHMLNHHCARLRESATSPFITGSFLESFTLEELSERQKDTLEVERDYRQEEAGQYDDEGLGGATDVDEEDLKQVVDGDELLVERVTITPSKSSISREMLERRFNCGRRDLRWMMRLDLINEGLTSLGKNSIFRWCPRLRCLSVDTNRLTTFQEVFEGGEGYLEQLSARDNLLEDLTGLEGLQKLTVLHLDGNFLTQLTANKKRTGKENSAVNTCATSNDCCGVVPGQLPEVCWSRLQVLTLACNRLTNVSQLGSLCPNLEVLDLGSNQLVTFGKREKNALTCLQHLRVLDVGQNKLKSRSLWEGLKHCPELVSLVASRNHLTELPNHFGSVLLREIWLNGNAIKQLGCKVWLPSLQRLYLQDNLITSLEPLWGCPALEVLDLSFNCISEHSQLQHLSGFPNLRSLQLNDNPISEQEDHADYVLQAVPWLAELDNEAVSKTSRDKAISTIFNNMMEVVGIAFVKEKLARGDTLLRGFTNPCSAHKISFNRQEHNENRNGQFLNRNIWEVNDVMNGEADEASLWAILMETKHLAQSSAVFQSLLTMNAEILKLGTLRVLTESEFEARSIMTAYQQMTHGLRGKLHAATKERCFRVSKETDISGQHIYQRWPLGETITQVGPLSRSSGVSGTSDKEGACHLEWCLEEHTTFDTRAYTEIYKENADYRLEAEAQSRRVVKLQALARAYMARKRVKVLLRARREKQELETRRGVVRVQALWRGWKVRREKILERLKLEAVERKLQIEAAIPIQARWRGYITRVKFQQAMKRAKYTDDDDFDYEPIDESDFLAGELALASYQPADMYLFALGSTSHGAKDTPILRMSALEEFHHEDTLAKDAKQIEASFTPQKCPGTSLKNTKTVEAAQTSTFISQPCRASSLDGNEKEVAEVAKNFNPLTCLVSGAKAIEKVIEVKSVEGIIQTKSVDKEKRSKEVKSPDPPVQLDQKSLKELIESMGFNSPFPSKSVNTEAKEVPEGDVCTTISRHLDRLISSSVDSEQQIITSERAESPMGESKKKATLDDKKAAIEEIAKDWGFKSERTAEAYMKARERTMKKAKDMAQQQTLRDPETRFKRFKAKLGGQLPAVVPPLKLSESKVSSSYTAERQVNDCQKHLRERLCDSGGQILGAAPISHRNAALLQPAKDQKKISSVTEIPTEMKMTEMKKDLRRVSINSSHGEISPWHIPKVYLNTSLDAFLIRDGQDSARK